MCQIACSVPCTYAALAIELKTGTSKVKLLCHELQLQCFGRSVIYRNQKNRSAVLGLSLLCCPITITSINFLSKSKLLTHYDMSTGKGHCMTFHPGEMHIA